MKDIYDTMTRLFCCKECKVINVSDHIMNDSIALICIKLLADICVNLVGVFPGTAGHGAKAEEWGTGRGGGLPCVGEEAGDVN